LNNKKKGKTSYLSIHIYKFQIIEGKKYIL